MLYTDSKLLDNINNLTEDQSDSIKKGLQAGWQKYRAIIEYGNTNTNWIYNNLGRK